MRGFGTRSSPGSVRLISSGVAPQLRIHRFRGELVAKGRRGSEQRQRLRTTAGESVPEEGRDGDHCPRRDQDLTAGGDDGSAQEKDRSHLLIHTPTVLSTRMLRQRWLLAWIGGIAIGVGNG